MSAASTARTLPGRLYIYILSVVVVIAVIAPILPLPDPNLQDLRARFTPPVGFDGTWEHVLGTDHLGRDMLARLVAGTRLTLLIAATAVLVAGVVGATLGVLAGYRGGWLDLVIGRLVDAQLALPFILLAIAIIAVQGRSLGVLVGVLALVSWAHYGRLLRAETKSLRERPFIPRLRASGLPEWRIITRHVLPNVGGTILVIATLQVGTMILGESSLSFLGLGVVTPDVSWGAMLAEGRQYLADSWWVVAFPGLAITGLVLTVNLLGDAMRKAYDPRKRTYR